MDSGDYVLTFGPYQGRKIRDAHFLYRNRESGRLYSRDEAKQEGLPALISDHGYAWMTWALSHHFSVVAAGCEIADRGHMARYITRLTSGDWVTGDGKAYRVEPYLGWAAEMDRQELTDLLSRFDKLSLECDGFCRVAAHALAKAGVPFESFAGSVSIGDRAIPLHYWLQCNGWTIDYRLRMWFGEQAPHGVFRAGEQPGLVYHGGECELRTGQVIFDILGGNQA